MSGEETDKFLDKLEEENKLEDLKREMYEYLLTVLITVALSFILTWMGGLYVDTYVTGFPVRSSTDLATGKALYIIAGIGIASAIGSLAKANELDDELRKLRRKRNIKEAVQEALKELKLK